VTDTLTRTEREELIRLTKSRARVAKSGVDHHKAELLADCNIHNYCRGGFHGKIADQNFYREIHYNAQVDALVQRALALGLDVGVDLGEGQF
jgi:hypothetical protein